jgi:hypothetical protein
MKLIQRRLLFITIDHVSAYLSDCGQLILEQRFVSTEAGLKEFALYASKHQRSLFSILADIPDEQFQKETVPYATGGDRVRLLKRKLSQIFYATRFSMAMSIDREKTGRKDENILLVALTRPQIFDPWLTILKQAECQVSGLYTLAQLADRFLPKKTTEFMLVTITSGGLRQTFVKQGALRFSRLTLHSSDDMNELSQSIATETKDLQQYLSSQQLLAQNAPLQVYILAHEKDITALSAHCSDTNDIKFNVLDIVKKAKSIGLNNELADSFSELLFLKLLTRKLPSSQFLSEPERLYYRFWQARATAIALAATFLISCISWAGYQAFNGLQFTDETKVVTEQNIISQHQYDTLMATLPAIPISNNSLRNLIEKYNIVHKHTASLEDTYAYISTALADEQKIEFSKIDWQVGQIDESTTLYVIADIHGELPVSMFSNHRGLLDTINAFVTRLKADKTVEVRILTMPFDIESSKTLRSDSAQSSTIPAPKFSVRVLRRLP